MAEFSELIKNFNKCRDYVRDFFVYGFKSRQDFTYGQKSARTYDDERRRITSWLSEYVVEDMTEQSFGNHCSSKENSADCSGSCEYNNNKTEKNRVKNISLQIDSNLLDTNPLFSVWKTKSFTDNDIILHFYLLDIMSGYNSSSDYAFSASELADIISDKYSFPADTQLVRRKCNEYVKEGLFETEKAGKTLLYKTGLTWNELFVTDSTAHYTSLINAISLLQLDCPFGYIGNTILERLQKSNKCFHIKHSFPTFTLEEEIAYKLIYAKNEHNYVKMDVMSNKSEQTLHPIYGVPLKILVSSRTGRRYVCIYHMLHKKAYLENDEPLKFRFRCIRLDQIKAVTIITTEDVSGKKRTALKSTIEAFEMQEKALEDNLPLVWGVSFEGAKTKVKLTLSINEEYETFILNRLDREGKHGTVTRISDNIYLYEKIVFDANEMFPWLRTFIGRIIDIHFIILNRDSVEIRENQSLRRQFLEDIEALTNTYLS